MGLLKSLTVLGWEVKSRREVGRGWGRGLVLGLEHGILF